jgi:hypothetical protein
MVCRTAVAGLIALLASVIPSPAADRDPQTGDEGLAAPARVVVVVAPLAAVFDGTLPPVRVGMANRGKLLPALYVGLSALNAYDVYSTWKGVANGAREANPIMRAVASNPGALFAIKGGTTVATIVLAERLWRQDRRVAAITMMIISNGLMATIAASNASVRRRS